MKKAGSARQEGKKTRKATKTAPPHLFFVHAVPRTAGKGEAPSTGPGMTPGRGKKKCRRPFPVPFSLFFFFFGGEEPGSSYKHISQQANTTQIHFRACYEAFDPNQMIFPPLPPTSLMGIGGNLPHPESVWRTKRSF